MSNEQIVVLSDKEQARQRINVFHGSATNWINMIKELVGNSLDVFDKDKLNHISIKIIDNKTIEYIDSGKGIPLEGTASDGRPNYVAVLEKAFAGSKYGSSQKTVGQNGIFLYTLAMSSELIKFEIARPNGNVYSISYHEGDRVSELEVVGKSENTYSKITFRLDDKVWRDINFTYDEIARIVQGQAAQSNVKIYLEDVQNGKNHTYYYENGLVEYFDELTINKTFVTDLIEINKSISQPVDKDIIDEVDVRFIMKYTNDSNDDIQKEFLNTADLIQHGTIQDGIAIALRKIVDKWLKANNKYNKSEKAITKDDVLTGLNYTCCVLSYQVEYDNQVKQKTSAVHYRKAMESILEEFFDVFQVENKFEFERICNQVLINKRARDKSESIRQNVKKQLNEKLDNTMFSRVEGLTDSKYHDEHSELFIAEGKSAKGSIELARDPKLHAVYAIRGKILSCLKASDETILSNQVIKDLIKVMGCGVELKSKKHKDLSNFDINNLRYGKIVCSCFPKHTKVKMLDGTVKDFGTLVEESENGVKEHWVYSTTKDGEIVPGRAINPRIIETTNKMCKVYLDDGNYFECTPDHMILTRDGEYIEAQYLKEGQSLMPLYTKIQDEYFNNDREMIFDNKKGKYIFTHFMVAEKLLDHKFEKYKQIHHVNFDYRNNEPNNLQIMDRSEHMRLHASQEENIKRLMQTAKHWGETYNGSEKHLQDIAKARAEGKYEKCTWKYTYNGSEKHRNDVRTAWKEGRYKGKGVSLFEKGYNFSEKNRETTRQLNRREDVKILQQRGRLAKFGKKLLDLGYELSEELIINKNYNVDGKGITIDAVNKYFDSFEDFIEYSKNRNHKVAKVEIYDVEPTEVYCMEVEKYHNFAIVTDGEKEDSMVFVKNCDADPDGEAIVVLILTMIYRLMKPLLLEGKVYVAQTPLFVVTELKTDKKYYAFTEKEKDEIVSKINGKYRVGRIKG